MTRTFVELPSFRREWLAMGLNDFEIREKLYLLTAYPKSEKDNLTKAERNELKQLVTLLEKQLETE